MAPVQCHLPAKKRIRPALWNNKLMNCKLVHRDYRYRDGGYRHDRILDDIGPNNTAHTAHNRINHGHEGKHNSINMRYILSRNIKGYIRLYVLPWNEYLYKFTKSDKAIR